MCVLIADVFTERELSPASRVIDAFQRAPVFRTIDKRNSDSRRRSGEHMFGAQDDVPLDDPMFILRRAVAYRQGMSRSRLSASLDEIALQHLHNRQSVQSAADSPTVTVEDHGHAGARKSQSGGMSRQELIAAQREASRANQRAMLSTQTNADRGVDVVLPNRAMLRSARLDANGAAPEVRYSYVEPDGETYDVSDIVEEEWRGEAGPGAREDLLEGAISQSREGIINRVIEKIKDSRLVPPSSNGSDRDRLSPAPPGSATSAAFSIASSVSVYSPASDKFDQAPRSTSRTVTPNSEGRATLRRESPQQIRQSPSLRDGPAHGHGHGKQQSSGTSTSDRSSSYDTSAPSTPATTHVTTGPNNTPAPRRAPLVLRDTDFGVGRMVALIELGAAMGASSRPSSRAVRREASEDIDDVLFGTKVDLDEFHPKVRDVYQDTLRQLDDLDLVSPAWRVQADVANSYGHSNWISSSKQLCACSAALGHDDSRSLSSHLLSRLPPPTLLRTRSPDLFTAYLKSPVQLCRRSFAFSFLAVCCTVKEYLMHIPQVLHMPRLR